MRDYDDALEQDERTINVHISHIRDKIEPDPAQPRYEYIDSSAGKPRKTSM